MTISKFKRLALPKVIVTPTPAFCDNSAASARKWIIAKNERPATVTSVVEMPQLAVVHQFDAGDVKVGVITLYHVMVDNIKRAIENIDFNDVV